LPYFPFRRLTSIMHRHLTRTLVTGAAVISAALVATDWPLGVWTGFWVEHALLGGVVSGLVLLVLGTLIVERYLESQDSKRWQRIAGIAYQELASSQLLAYRTLTVAAVGRENAADVHDFPEQDWEVLVEDLLRQHKTSPAGRPIRSLPVLAADGHWLIVVYEVVRDLDVQTRGVIARWAPVLIQTEDLCRGLNLVSDANESVHKLRGDLRRAVRAYDPDLDPRVSERPNSSSSQLVVVDHVTEVGESWLSAIRAALQARSDLFALLGKEDWSNPGWRTLEP